MLYKNLKFRVGPPAVQDELFKMPDAKGKMRKGKKFEIPAYLAGLGLNAYEFSAGRMSSFSDSSDYAKFRTATVDQDVAVSIHAPYYISLTSETPETYEKSIERLANVYQWAVWLNAKRIVLHPGTYSGGRPTQKLLKMITDGIQRGQQMANDRFTEMKAQFQEIALCLETMGKPSQLGPTEEIITLCKDLGIDRCRPCIDFGHLYTRNIGKLDGRKLYESQFSIIEKELGADVVKQLHIHWSKIEYSDKGEVDHVPNTDKQWGPDLKPLLEIIHEQDYTPIIINESPELEPDAKRIMDAWKKIAG